MTVGAIDPAQLTTHTALSAAGFPTDHREPRGDGFKLKDLWGSDGRLVGVVAVSTAGAFIQTTIQTTPGNSGGPIYGDFNGGKHIVVGMSKVSAATALMFRTACPIPKFCLH